MSGDFTLPGEAGYEALTLRLADQWGADAIRDSDGTKLSPELTGGGRRVYSTICLIRSINDFAKAHPEMLQQNLLLSMPVLAESDTVQIDLLAGYSRDQFRINNRDGREFWQVYDRTSGEEIDAARWRYADGFVKVDGAAAYHQYTVSFFAFRLWEAISMYNHITNGWGDRERLMPVEPRHPEVREALLSWLTRWCKEHPETDIVRFTSLFYNFAWIWSDDPTARDLYSDWASYDFTVNPLSLRAFRAETGIGMTAEDFLRGGLRNPAHTAPTDKMRRWIDFTHTFVAGFGRECVDIVHRFGKKAYVFYDDSWVGMEPFGPHFSDLGMDGIVKCVFGGFETRLCAAVPHVATREIRLHPYLFPTGLKGEPTFASGGDPTGDLIRYWVQARRALLRRPVDRIGLGGYLHLVEPFPDFCDAVARLAGDFRVLKALHANGAPRTLPGKVAVVTAWGALRTWSTSGHLHEHPEVDLTNVLEALSGLPVEVEFISLDDLKAKGVPEGVSVLVNAGWTGSAWTGGDGWRDPALVAKITKWVHAGGGLVGVREPGACEGFHSLALSHLFGVGVDDGRRKCQRKYARPENTAHFLAGDGVSGLESLEGAYMDAGDVNVVCQTDGALLTARDVGQGRAVYLSGYRFSLDTARLILRAIAFAGRMEDAMDALVTDNKHVDMARFEDKVVLVNNTAEAREVRVPGLDGKVLVPGFGQKVIDG